MSHVTTVSDALTIPESELIHLLNAIREFCPDLELVENQNHYRTWAADHGSAMGVPEGWSRDDVGKNAKHVIRVTDAALRGRFNISDRNQSGAPYEIGVVPVRVIRDDAGNLVKTIPDPNGTEYTLATDWFNNGNGLLSVEGLGAHTRDYVNPQTGKRGEMAFGDLYMHYRMMQAKHEAEMQGDTLTFEKQKDGTYVAVADTVARVGA